MTYVAEDAKEDVDDGVGRADAGFDPNCEIGIIVSMMDAVVRNMRTGRASTL